MQGLNLADIRTVLAGLEVPQAWTLASLPDLSGLTKLEALNLAENSLSCMPPSFTPLLLLVFEEHGVIVSSSSSSAILKILLPSQCLPIFWEEDGGEAHDCSYG
jgi:hypothetical protein